MDMDIQPHQALFMTVDHVSRRVALCLIVVACSADLACLAVAYDTLADAQQGMTQGVGNEPFWGSLRGNQP